LFAGLKALGRKEAELQTSKKSAAWKVALARHLRERLLVPNSWLAAQLRMGTPQSVSSRVSRHRKEPERSVDSDWSILRMLECVD
jgi:hypothetical protein